MIMKLVLMLIMIMIHDLDHDVDDDNDDDDYDNDDDIDDDGVSGGEEPGEEEEDTVHRLNPEYSSGVSSPGRHVRTRLYFTSESHIHSLLTVLSHGGLVHVSWLHV